MTVGRVRHALLALLLAAPAPAILGQVSIQSPPSERTLPVGEQVESDMSTARFRLGPVRLLPFLEVDNVGWTNNALVTSEGTVDDYTASVSAGARLLVPIGRKVYLRGLVAPTYDWYYETEALRGFGGEYSAQLLGLFNRLTVGAGGGYEKAISTVSSEVARDVFNTTESATAKAELELLDRLSLFGGAETERLSQDDPNAATPGLSPVSFLDRTNTSWRLGLRYAFTPVLSFGVMGEAVSTRYEEEPELRDGNARGLYLVARYDRERFYVEATVGATQVRPVTPNEYFPGSRTSAYGYLVSYFLTWPLEVRARGSRRPVASLFLDNPYFLETRNGLTLVASVGRRVSIHVTAELGSNTYLNPVIVVETGEVLVRRDGTTSYGGGFRLRLSKALSIGLTATKDRWDSNIDYYDRETVRVTGGLVVATDFRREERR